MAYVQFNRKPFEGSFSNFVDDLFTELPVMLNNGFNNSVRKDSVPVNVKETAVSYELEVVAPGFEKADFKVNLGKVSYHIPCHSRVQNVGRKTEEMLKMTGAEVNTVERCAGHDGTWGVKEEYYELSMKIGKPVFKAMAQNEPDYVSSDCAIAGRHILQGMNEAGATGRKEKQHPLTLLRIAYGLE